MDGPAVVIIAGGEMTQMGYEDSTRRRSNYWTMRKPQLPGIMDSNDRGRITPIDIALAKLAGRLADLRAQDSSMTGM